MGERFTVIRSTDRMLVAQARLESLVLLTADRQLEAYGAPVIVA